MDSHELDSTRLKQTEATFYHQQVNFQLEEEQSESVSELEENKYFLVFKTVLAIMNES